MSRAGDIPEGSWICLSHRNLILAEDKRCSMFLQFLAHTQTFDRGVPVTLSQQARTFLRRGRQPDEDISHARTVVSPRFLYQASLMERRYYMQMRSCEDKLKGKTAHFRLPSASQKRACLSPGLKFPNLSQHNLPIFRSIKTGFLAKSFVTKCNKSNNSCFCITILIATWRYPYSAQSKICYHACRNQCVIGELKHRRV